MENIKLPKIKLSEPERKWMELLWHKVKNNEKYNYKILRAQLYKDIPKDFHPKQISRLLVDAKGERITLLGVYSVDPKTDLIGKSNRIILRIKEIILENPATQAIISSEIGANLGINEEEVGLIFYLFSGIGWLIRSATISNKYTGYNSIDLGDGDEVFDQYLNFNSVEELVLLQINKEKLSQRREKNKAINQKDNSLETENKPGIVFKPIFNSKVSQVDSHLCFVLMPFGEVWSDRVYKMLLRETIDSLGLQCLRADNLTGQIIIEDIWTKINQAAFIIADVTNWNSNVMYELGIVHSIGKPAILITQDLKKIPFDFKHLRHFEYEDNAESFIKFKNRLKEVVIDLYRIKYQDVVLAK